MESNEPEKEEAPKNKENETPESDNGQWIDESQQPESEKTFDNATPQTEPTDLGPELELLGTIKPNKIKPAKAMDELENEKPKPKKEAVKDNPKKDPDLLPAATKKDYTALIVAVLALVLMAVLFWLENRRKKKQEKEALDNDTVELDENGIPYN